MANFHFCEQGSAEWFALRIGRPTASQFHRIVTPTGKLSTSARAYAHYLIAERVLGRSLETELNLEWIVRGRELESEAVSAYEFIESAQTRKVGFVTSDDGRLGASPDRLIIGANAGLEIKVPAPQTHIGYLLADFGDHYRPQVHGQIYVSEFDYIDLYSYSPEMPPVHHRTYRDEAFIGKLGAALCEFCDRLDELEDHIRAKGLFAERRGLLTPADQLATAADEDPFGLAPLAGFEG